GTIVDFGCFAPVVSIVEAFAARGVIVTMEEARGPMGLEKREHLRRLLADDGIAARWKFAVGADPCPSDADSLYEDLEPRLLRAVRKHAGLIPGARELAEELRGWGIRIGSTTGYLRPVMDILTEQAAQQGLEPDAVVCPSDVPAGRPYPWMCFLNATRLSAFPPRRVVKIGDTPADMEEGLNAGMWTIGVTLSGNEVGLSEAAAEQLSPEGRREVTGEAEMRLRAAGAHYVTESVGTCRELLARIEERIMKGEHPAREKVRERV
ncbi:MAG TPA: phosphonoacetaldehyde hydrolase, partial [Spirochaetia bacterium]|nr:phosphonoacetaldehyde hydrolase [Spirochaetia bacterium]